MTQARKAVTAIFGTASFALSLLMMGDGYNLTALTIAGLASATAIALMLGEWTRN